MNQTEYALGITVPIEADYVLSPTVLYDDELTGIYFNTEDEQYGRITFSNLDAIRVCRGEYLPYPDDWTEDKEVPWVYVVQHSKWQMERYRYEKSHYGRAYEFGGDVEDMRTDFKHYIFKFHDQFVEVIARGFWWEKDTNSLMNQPLQVGHPFLNLPTDEATLHQAHGLTTQITKNTLPIDVLIEHTQYCSQKLYQFALILEGTASVDNTVSIVNKDGKTQSELRGYFGRKAQTFDGIPTLEEILPYIENYMSEVAERRRAMRK